MSESAGRIVKTTNRIFSEIGKGRDVARALDGLIDLTMYAEQVVVLDPDVNSAFNQNARSLRCLTAAHHSLEQLTPEGDRVFLPNGYTVAATTSGVVAVYSALSHHESAEQPDPVEQVHGSYSYMAIVKAARGLVLATYGNGQTIKQFCDENEIEPWTLGLTASGSHIVGVTGGLFAHGRVKERDIRMELVNGLDVQVACDELIDVTAGLADQRIAEGTLVRIIDPSLPRTAVEVTDLIEAGNRIQAEGQNIN